MNLSAGTLRIWSFRTPTSIFCTKELCNPGLLPSPRLGTTPLFGSGQFNSISFIFKSDWGPDPKALVRDTKTEAKPEMMEEKKEFGANAYGSG